jgi:hypothetical protein
LAAGLPQGLVRQRWEGLPDWRRNYEEIAMDHIEAHRLLELAEMSVIADQPEFEHIRNCDDCSIAFLQLRDMLVGA